MKMVCGIDMQKADRIKKSIQNENFYRRVFSKEEHALFESKNNNIETISANFCVKEAFSKALGTGIVGFSLNEVYALRDNSGAPYLVLTGKAKELADERNLTFSVSISHDGGFAIAMVIGYEVN